MSTILGIEVDRGAVLAGDRLQVAGGITAATEFRRVFGFEKAAAGAAAAGEPGEIDSFRSRLAADVRRYRTDHGGPIGVERLARVAADVAEATGAAGIVAARDDAAVARIRSVRADGAVLDGPTAAIGTGAELALGRLDAMDRSGALREVEARVRELYETVGARDPGTGTEADTWTLATEAD